MARTSPLGKIKDVAIDTLRNPLGVAGKAVDQARETAALGRKVAGQATRTATGTATGAVSAVGHLVPGRRKPTSVGISSVPDISPVPQPVSKPPARKAAPRTTVPKASFVDGPEPTMTTADPTTHQAGPTAVTPLKPAAKKSAARKPAPPKRPAVDVTPADVAKNMGTDPTVEPAPGAELPAAATLAPGDKLPPRRKTPSPKAPAVKGSAASPDQG